MRKLPAALLLVLMLVLATAPDGWGQAPSPGISPSPSPSPGASPEPSPSPSPAVAVPMEYRSARATLETFLASMKRSPARPDRQALDCLDLSVAPAAVRDTGGVQAAIRLFAILEAIGPIDLRQVPKAPDAEPYTLYRQPTGSGIVLARGPDGAWRFTGETVADAFPMHDHLVEKGRLAQAFRPYLDVRFVGLYGYQWVVLVCLPLLGYLLGRMVAAILSIALRSRLDPSARRVRHRVIVPACWLAGSLSLWSGLRWLDLPFEFLTFFTFVAKTAASITAVLTSFFVLDLLEFRAQALPAFSAPRYRDLLFPLTSRTLKIGVGLLGLLFILQNLDVNVWSLFAGVSVLGAMIALAGQDFMKNLFGSVTVVMDRPFEVGDWVLIEGTEGTVEDVGFRSTRVRTFHDSLVTVPNSVLLTACVENYGARRYRRYMQHVHLALDTPPDRIEAFCEGAREIVRQHPLTRKDSYHIWVNDVSPYSLKVLLYLFWQCPDWTTELRERHRFLVDLVRLARTLGVELVKPSSLVEVQRHRHPQPEAPMADRDPVEVARALVNMTP